jgi:hypothetical protein
MNNQYSLCNSWTIATRSLCNHFVIVLPSLRHHCTIAVWSLCDYIANATHNSAFLYRLFRYCLIIAGQLLRDCCAVAAITFYLSLSIHHLSVGHAAVGCQLSLCFISTPPSFFLLYALVITPLLPIYTAKSIRRIYTRVIILLSYYPIILFFFWRFHALLRSRIPLARTKKL